MKLITLETARLCKEVGFNDVCFHYYFLNSGYLTYKEEESNGESEYFFEFDDFQENWNQKNLSVLHPKTKKYELVCSAPYQQQVVDWLREEHNCYIQTLIELYSYGLQINMQVLFVDEHEDSFSFNPNSTGWFGDNGEFKTIPEAIEKGIQIALRKIKSKNEQTKLN